MRNRLIPSFVLAASFTTIMLLARPLPHAALAQSSATPSALDAASATIQPTATATATLLAPLPTEGSILREYWLNIPGNGPDDLRLDSDFPSRPDFCDYGTEISTTPNLGGNFGARLRGYLTPPSSGEYIFWIGSDNASEFWLSTTGSPDHLRKLLDFDSFADYLDFDSSLQQESYPVILQARQRRYFEVIFKEDESSYNWVAVAWLGPGIEQRQVVGAQYLSSAGLRCDIDAVPTAAP